MKTQYFIFSRMLVLNVIAVFITFGLMQGMIIGIVEMFKTGVEQFFYLNHIYIVFYVLYLLIYIWLLTSTFLPIIKIDDVQIKAYSIFWRRTIKWEEIKSVKLIKASFARSDKYSGLSFGLTFTKISEKIHKIGARTQTFIIVSKKGIKIPTKQSRQLFSHIDLASKDAIAFEFSDKAISIIQEKLKIQVLQS